MKMAIVLGNRPHFIKCAPLLKAIRDRGCIEIFLIHSGQHYDMNLSGIFLRDFDFPPIDVNLAVGSAPPAVQTGLILSRLDPVLQKCRPDRVISMGDTNTTLAASLAAYYRHIPNAHVEAGMRECIWRPEEINKKMADHCADYLFAPIPRAVENLEREGVEKARIFLSGDITLDTFCINRKTAEDRFDDLRTKLNLPDCYDLVTLHRAESVDDRAILAEILSAFSAWPRPLVFPVHPRTGTRIAEFGLEPVLKRNDRIIELPPLSYLDFLSLLLSAHLVATDSSGVLKEAFYAGKPCLALDDTSEYRELFDLGVAVLGGRRKDTILKNLIRMDGTGFPEIPVNPFGTGRAAETIVRILIETPPFFGSGQAVARNSFLC
ncbi:UDP-N-acetylglucosamine 2-epimerase (non-hydrolyzing) [bacterium]|nr:UDP-N-acetylglucosamine 2-epimerase (non-hydrolyzing) [candidate division CSSED10-310 bacterium]